MLFKFIIIFYSYIIEFDLLLILKKKWREKPINAENNPNSTFQINIIRLLYSDYSDNIDNIGVLNK